MVEGRTIVVLALSVFKVTTRSPPLRSKRLFEVAFDRPHSAGQVTWHRGDAGQNNRSGQYAPVLDGNERP